VKLTFGDNDTIAWTDSFGRFEKPFIPVTDVLVKVRPEIRTRLLNLVCRNVHAKSSTIVLVSAGICKRILEFFQSGECF